MAAKKAKGKGAARRSGLVGLDPVEQVAALRTRLAGLLERLSDAERALAEALRHPDGARAPARSSTRKPIATATQKPAVRPRRPAPPKGA